MLSFNFADKNSLDDFGIYIETMPTIPSPERRVSFITMPGRHGTIRYDEKSYEDITIAVSCGFVGNIMDKLQRIKAWLFESGESDLIFSFSPDKRYIAQVVNRIDFEFALSKIGSFIIVFHCRPFQYAVTNTPLIVTAKDTNYINTGTVASEPIIDIYGSGDVAVKINDDTFSLANLISHATVNSVLQEVYSASYQNLNNTMSGEFPQFVVGDNNITWEGNVERLVITPNTRWL